MANVFNTARYILSKIGRISTWKLQKLCYYSQAWSLAWTEQPLFPEDFQAWANGPVCPTLFYQHSGKFSVDINDFPQSLENDPALNADQKETIDLVLEHYGNWEPYALREQTHHEAPWLDARKGLPDGANCAEIITKDAMGFYYGSL